MATSRHKRPSPTFKTTQAAFSLPFRPLERTLENGLSIVAIPFPYSKVAAVNFTVKSGSSVEKESQSGGIHFLEHLIFCGTKRRPDTHILTRELERLGAFLDGETSKEDTTYSVRTPINYLEIACDVLADMFFNSTITSECVERESQVILEEHADDVDDIDWNCSRQLERMMFGDSALSRPVIGSRDFIAQCDRHDLLRLKARWYRPSNTQLVVAGPVDESFFDLAAKYFNHGTLQPCVAPRIKLTPSKKRFATVPLPRDRAVVKVAFPTPGHKALPEPEVVLAEMILGRSSYSRLDDCLRLKNGIAYSFDCGRIIFQQGGYLEISAEVAPSKVMQVINVLLDCLTTFHAKGATESELADAKTCATGRAILGTQTCSDLADFVSDELLTQGEITHPEKLVSRLQDVTLEGLNSVINELFNPQSCKIVVGGRILRSVQSPF